ELVPMVGFFEILRRAQALRQQFAHQRHRRRILLVGLDAFHRLLKGGQVEAALIGAEGEIGRVRRRGRRARRPSRQQGNDKQQLDFAPKTQAEASARSIAACACATAGAGPRGSAKISAAKAMNSAPVLAKASTSARSCATAIQGRLKISAHQEARSSTDSGGSPPGSRSPNIR